jgi:hypothetical protein
VLFEFTCVPRSHHKALFLSLELDVQRVFYESRTLDLSGLSGHVAKRVRLPWYLNLDSTELSNPFASQVSLGTRRYICGDGQDSSHCHGIVSSHDDLLGSLGWVRESCEIQELGSMTRMARLGVGLPPMTIFDGSTAALASFVSGSEIPASDFKRLVITGGLPST